MITYKLALELKKAGFPQGHDGEFCCRGEYYQEGFHDKTTEELMNGTGKLKDYVFAPPLDELIEACGDGYFKLEHSQCAWAASMGLYDEVSAFDENIESAVAKLYLSLNKK